jgi:hypothetical protein
MEKFKDLMKTGFLALGVTFALAPLHTLYTTTMLIAKGVKAYKAKSTKK